MTVWRNGSGICLSFLTPWPLPASKSAEPPPYFDWQAENFEINAPLGGLTGVAERGQVLGLQERIKQCLTKLRAEPFAEDAPEYLALEVYLSARSNGLPIETPAIRY